MPHLLHLTVSAIALVIFLVLAWGMLMADMGESWRGAHGMHGSPRRATAALWCARRRPQSSTMCHLTSPAELNLLSHENLLAMHNTSVETNSFLIKFVMTAA